VTAEESGHEHPEVSTASSPTTRRRCVGAILLPLAIFMVWSTPTVTLVIVLAVLALLMLFAIEVLGRAPGPAEVATPTPAT
jgi:hypothetical protein